MKQDFFNYLGPADSLANYSRSYKLIFLKELFNIIDTNGRASTYAVASNFKNYYVQRKLDGKIPDINVEPRIANIEKSAIEDILAVIKDNPYKVINDKGFVSIAEVDGESQFIINAKLFSELSKDDYIKLNNILDNKIKLYFSKIKEDTGNNLENLFTRILDEYYICRTTQTFASNPIGNVFRNQIVEVLKQYVDQSRYIIRGSVGQGNWANIPWISIFDKRITTTAMEGVYIVYLLSDDGKRLYLTLNQGSTKLISDHGYKKAMQMMQQVASNIREFVYSRDFIKKSEIMLGKEPYEQGCILYKEYKLGLIPNNDELINDIKNMIEIYDEYYLKGIDKKISSVPIDELPKEEGDKMEFNVSEEITRISEYIAEKGFSYKTGLIENFYLCLKTKPFVILAGTSGTGKTRLVKLFAESVDATSYNNRYKLVPVRPDWSDSTDLFGHLDLNGKYKNGVLTEFIKSAIDDPINPYFVCLDEMNLARVEYYLSDILSIIETRHFEENIIRTDTLISVEAFGSDVEASGKYSSLYIPDNLYIVGTVNMDETTFPFSKKVLDRANTIEISHVDLDLITKNLIEVSSYVLDNSFLRSEYLLACDCIGYEDLLLGVISTLKQINNVLYNANAQFGYRVRDEICFYMVYNEKYNIIEYNKALDNCILQKILPRIQGSNFTIKELLIDLFKIFLGNQEELFQENDNNIYEEMLKYLDSKMTFKASAEKVAFMMRRFEEDGYTSYWL